ncbi:uncharacterized protein M6B38_393325 [Iris pallida]|uniref:Protein WVD2-like 7 n=1 Tax=Iris pallida TaxID=29817 RepID=A0AAX6FXM7_IRIPA|nr:uncharacterized protein M6B38_393325 [Iris pallida]
MTTYVDQAYYDWAHDDVTHQDESQEVSASQILDHGSISFGRFAHESLSWERRSVFTHNKCQEELEKFKCPGLVAKKKAYFEEYYKRIRAMKESQENQQTELTLDYGGDESISSQNGEEDEIAARLGNLGEEAINIVGDDPEEASLEISVEKEKEMVEDQNRQSDPITTTIDHGSLRSDFENLGQEDYTKYPLGLEEASVEVSMLKEILEVQSRHSDAETTTVNLDSMRRNSEDHEQQDKTMYPLELEEASVEVSMVKEILEVQGRHSDAETTTIHLDSLRRNSKDHEQQDKAIYPLELEEASVEVSMVKEILEVQSRHSDAETTTVNLDSLRKNSEDHEQQDKTMCPLQMQHLDTENQDYESLTRIAEVAEQHDFDNLDKEDSSGEHSVIHSEPNGASKATELHPSSSKLGDFELKSAKKMVSGKVTPHVRNHMDRVSIHRVKEPSAAGRNGSKLEDKTKPGIVKPPQGPKNASERTPKKSGILAGSSKTSSDRVSRHCKSFFTPSHRPLTEVQSSVTVTRPFSLATDRRAAVLSGNRDGPTKSDQKSSNKRIPLAVHRKDVNVQGSSKRSIFPAGAQSRGLENKRCHEERKNPLPLDRQRIGLKDRSANLPELPRARSVNLPPRNNCNSSSGIDNRIRGDHRANTQKEEKSDGRLREACRTGRRVATPPPRNLGCETKKVIPSRTGNSSIIGRKLPYGEQSLDGKKPRQEKPRWR